MYAQCGMIEDAIQVFHNMLEKDVVLWTTLILGYAKNEHYDEAVELFCKMKRDRINPNQFTFSSMLSACASLAALEHGKGIHTCIFKRKFESYLSIVDPGGYWWPPTYSTWTHTIVSFSFSVSLIVAQFTIFSSSSGPELLELF
jgi:pentatricopeptide repeat protein